MTSAERAKLKFLIDRKVRYLQGEPRGVIRPSPSWIHHTVTTLPLRVNRRPPLYSERY